MGEMKPTPGPWEVYTPAGEEQTYGISADDGTAVVWFGYNAEEGIQNFDDARLIAEAGTVFHNTGLSPVQLVEMVKELKAALNLWLGTADNPNAGWRGAGGSDVLFACEHCGEKHEDCTKLEHADDCPITLARAALAKCEGVGNG